MSRLEKVQVLLFVLVILTYALYVAHAFRIVSKATRLCNSDRLMLGLEIQTIKHDLAQMFDDPHILDVDNIDVVKYVAKTETCDIPKIVLCLYNHKDERERLSCIRN